MGTNYYLYNDRNRAERETEDFHIGKSSCGWVFHFESHNKPEIKTVEAMREYTKLGFIYDEYGVEHTYADFWRRVENTKKAYCGRKPYVLDDPENPEPHLFKRWEDEGYCFSEGEFC